MNDADAMRDMTGLGTLAAAHAHIIELREMIEHTRWRETAAEPPEVPEIPEGHDYVDLTMVEILVRTEAHGQQMSVPFLSAYDGKGFISHATAAGNVYMLPPKYWRPWRTPEG